MYTVGCVTEVLQRRPWQLFLCLWSRASLICINNCPTRCNTKQSIYYSASSLYMFRVTTTPIIRCTHNCNCSLRYWSYSLCSYLPPTWPSWPRWREVAAQHSMPSTGGSSYSFVYSWWWVWLTPETCRVNLQNNKQTALCCISLDNY